MLYLGGKGRIGASIAKVVLAHTPQRARYLEPFLGGGNVFRHLAGHFDDVQTGDVHEDLMCMWSAAATGWVPPTSVSETEYQEARASSPSALRGFIGFGCSYGGKWWGGYARNKVVGMRERSHPDYYARLASRDVSEIGALLRSANLARRSYSDYAPSPATVVYADPPYRCTTGYRMGFDSDAFWKTMTRWADVGAHVYVSEYAAPDEWVPIWSKSQRRKVSGGTGDDTTEHLFVRRL